MTKKEAFDYLHDQIDIIIDNEKSLVERGNAIQNLYDLIDTLM